MYNKVSLIVIFLIFNDQYSLNMNIFKVPPLIIRSKFLEAIRSPRELKSLQFSTFIQKI